MTLNRKIGLSAATLMVLASAGGGIAVAASGDAPQGEPHAAAPEVTLRAQPLSPKVAEAFAALRTQTPSANGTTLAAGSRLAQVARTVKELPAESVAHDLDLARAIEVPAKGTTTRVWLAPAGDEVCTIIEDPADGSGTGCSTLEEIDRGTGISVLGPLPNGQFVVASPVPDGAAAPTVTVSETKRPIAATRNVAAEAVPSASRVASGNGPEINLGALGKARE